MMAQTQPAQGPDRERASTARPDLAREQDVRSGLWPKPWMAKAKVPSAAIRPTLHLTRGKPRSDRIGGDGLSFGDFSLATQRKVTRPSPKGGRNPFEDNGLVSYSAQPSHLSPTPQSGRLRLTANRPYTDATLPHQDPSPALPFPGEGAKASQPARRETEQRPTVMTGSCQAKGGPGRPYRPKKGSQSLNTGCNPACRTAAATSPRVRSSWMVNCSSSSLSPSA